MDMQFHTMREIRDCLQMLEVKNGIIIYQSLSNLRSVLC